MQTQMKNLVVKINHQEKQLLNVTEDDLLSDTRRKVSHQTQM